MDELFDSGIKLGYPPEYKYIFDLGDETVTSKVQRNLVNRTSYWVCVEWAVYQKNVSFVMTDIEAEVVFASGYFVGENSEPLVRRLEDGFVYSFAQTIIMFHGDPLLKRFAEIIDRVVETGIQNHWISVIMNKKRLLIRKIAIFIPLDGY
jgi:hypothetical protein